MSSWFRLNTDFFIHDDICDLPLVTRFSVIAVISYVKLFGRRGEVKATASMIARATQTPINEIESALKTDFFEVSGKQIKIPNWFIYQVDTTSKERQSRFNRNKRETPLVTADNGYNDTGTGTGTVTYDILKKNIVDFWNQKSPPLPKIIKFSKSRQNKLKVRLGDKSFVENWQAVIDRMADTPFLLGDNDRGWKVNFDWLIENDKNYVKVLEGRYDDNGRTINAGSKKPQQKNDGSQTDWDAVAEAVGQTD
jgi:hypothetical protein